MNWKQEQHRILAIAFIPFIIFLILLSVRGEYPLNDDWGFTQSIKTSIEQHTFWISPWSNASFILQYLIAYIPAKIFGFSFLLMSFLTTIATSASIATAYILLRKLALSELSATLGSALLALNPLIIGLSPTFLTDTYFLLFFLLTLTAYVHAAQTNNNRWWIIATLLACAAGLIRQPGFILPFAAAAWSWKYQRDWKRISTCIILPIVFGTALYAFQNYYVNADALTSEATKILSPTGIAWLAGRTIWRTFVLISYQSLFLLPLLITLPFKKNNKTWIIIALVSGGLITASIITTPILPTWVGNILHPAAIGPKITLGSIPIPPAAQAIWALITLATMYALVKALTNLKKPSSEQKLVLGITVMLYLFLIITPNFFDRYFITFIIPLYAYFSRITIMKKIIPSLIIFILISGWYGTAGTYEYLSWNNERWNLLNTLTDKGIPPNEIDGGFEFNGWHLYNQLHRSTYGSWWFVINDTYAVSTCQQPQYRVLAQKNSSTIWPIPTTPVYLSQRITPSPAREKRTF